MNTSPVGGALLRATTIQDWIKATAGTEIRVGLTTEAAREKAIRVSDQLVTGKHPDLKGDFPDIAHALVRLVEEVGPDSVTAETVATYYFFIEGLSWPGDEFSEKAALKARLAYLVWKSCLRNWDYTKLKRWERLCLENLRHDYAAQEFLALPIAKLSAEVRRRFLVDRPILMAFSARLADARNRAPGFAETEAKEFYAWISKEASLIGNGEDVSYFLGETAISISTAARHLGHFAAADSWLVTAETCFGEIAFSEPWCARVALCRVVGLNDAHRGDAVLSVIDEVTARLEHHGMSEELCVAKFVKALALKNKGRTHEALLLAEQLRGTGNLGANLRCQVLLHIAELRTGDAVGRNAICEAFSIIRETKSVMNLAALLTLVGELSRSSGHIAEATEAFRAAVQLYESAGMSVFAAYIRLILADTLLLEGRDHEAIAEVAAALPIVERERMLPDIAQAVALLRKCVDQKRLEPPVLARLRQQLRPWQ